MLLFLSRRAIAATATVFLLSSAVISDGQAGLEVRDVAVDPESARRRIDQIIADAPWLAVQPDGRRPVFERLRGSRLAEAVSSYARELSLDEEEARKRVLREDAYPPIVSLAQALAAEQAAGSWLHQEAGVIEILAVGDAARLTQSVRGHLSAHPWLSAFADDVVIASAQFTWAELLAVRERALEMREGWVTSSGGAVRVGIDVLASEPGSDSGRETQS